MASSSREPPKMRLRAISIIVPAYNEERRLGNTLTQLLKTLDADFEIVIAEDSSTDPREEL